ncbi:MAG: hypothetical protein PF689_00745 [Deltaproteobacteria bacterium]|jgi:hypothetical protein|nr:hypothetical protein [Deltaproteobacteria bacterium]
MSYLFKNGFIFFLMIWFAFLASCEDYEKAPSDYLKDWPEAENYKQENSLQCETDIPEDISEWSEVELPLEISGQDNGDESILYSVSIAHYWLLKNQLPSGNYLYDWNAKTGETTDTTSTIQMLATAWSQLLVHRFLQHREFLLAAYRAIKVNMGSLSDTVTADTQTTIAHAGSLARTAFLAFCLIEFEDIMEAEEFREDIDKIGEYFLYQVDESGCIYNQYPHNNECGSSYSEFAVGQALVALERFYRYTKDERYLNKIEAAANYYYNYYHTEAHFSDDIYFVSWATGPIVSLLLERPDPEMEEWVYEMADYMESDQYQPTDRVDYIGGFKRRSDKPPTWSAASMLEGILDAYRLAKARGDQEKMEKYHRAGRFGVHFLINLQYRVSNVDKYDLIDPERAIGAYHFSHWKEASSISRHYIRTDYMDHFAITILKAISYLDLPVDYPGDGFAE